MVTDAEGVTWSVAGYIQALIFFLGHPSGLSQSGASQTCSQCKYFTSSGQRNCAECAFYPLSPHGGDGGFRIGVCRAAHQR